MLDRGRRLALLPAALTPEWDGPSIGTQGLYKWIHKICPWPVFDLRSVQRIASRYMDYATPAHKSGYFGEEKVSFPLPLLETAPIFLGRPRPRPTTELSWILKGRVLWRIFNLEDWWASNSVGIMWGRKCCMPCRESNQNHYVFRFITSSVRWPSNTNFLWLNVIITWVQKLRKESLHSTEGLSSSKQTAIYVQYQTRRLGPLHTHKVTFRLNLSFVNLLT